MKTLYVMQGAPGSGKSTVARTIEAGLVAMGGDCEIYSTDDYFTNCQTGEYKFDPTKLAQYHQANQDKARAAMDKGLSDVVIDNTNVRAAHAAPYVKAAVEFGYAVVFVRCEGRFANTHGVPAEKVEAMRAAMEPLSVAACLACEV